MRKLKRFIVSLFYINVAYKLAEEMSIDTCKEFLGMGKNDNWISNIHFKQVVIRLQFQFADELLKQENL